MNIVIPAAGAGSRFANAGYQHPKPFIPIKGKSMIDHVIDNIATRADRVYVILRTEHLSRLNDTMIPYRKNVAVIPLSEPTEGAACTVLKAKAFIDNDTPLIIANSDQYVRFDRKKWEWFMSEKAAGMMVFTPETPDAKWSYAKLDTTMGFIERVAEKEAISHIATVGVYYFSGGYMFCSAARSMIESEERVNGEFYVAPTFNHLGCLKYPFFVDTMYGMGDPGSFTENYEKVGT